MSEWIDISVCISDELLVWPGDPPVGISKINDMESGDEANLTRLNISAHTGTHMDAPRHFVKNGPGLDKIPLDAVVGECRVIEIEDTVSIKSSELKEYDIREGERILFKTRNADHEWENNAFMDDFVHFETEAAEYLAALQPRLIGIDYLSVSGYNKNETAVHQKFLEAGIWIIEGLKLKNVSRGKYELICLPIKIKDSDGAPARAIVRKIQG